MIYAIIYIISFFIAFLYSVVETNKEGIRYSGWIVLICTFTPLLNTIIALVGLLSFMGALNDEQ